MQIFFSLCLEFYINIESKKNKKKNTKKKKKCQHIRLNNVD